MNESNSASKGSGLEGNTIVGLHRDKKPEPHEEIVSLVSQSELLAKEADMHEAEASTAEMSDFMRSGSDRIESEMEQVRLQREARRKREEAEALKERAEQLRRQHYPELYDSKEGVLYTEPLAMIPEAREMETVDRIALHEQFPIKPGTFFLAHSADHFYDVLQKQLHEDQKKRQESSDELVQILTALKELEQKINYTGAKSLAQEKLELLERKDKLEKFLRTPPDHKGFIEKAREEALQHELQILDSGKLIWKGWGDKRDWMGNRKIVFIPEENMFTDVFVSRPIDELSVEQRLELKIRKPVANAFEYKDDDHYRYARRLDEKRLPPQAREYFHALKDYADKMPWDGGEFFDVTFYFKDIELIKKWIEFRIEEPELSKKHLPYISKISSIYALARPRYSDRISIRDIILYIDKVLLGRLTTTGYELIKTDLQNAYTYLSYEEVTELCEAGAPLRGVRAGNIDGFLQGLTSLTSPVAEVAEKLLRKRKYVR